MLLSIFYNGTDSNYDKDFKKEGRFIHGEIVSRFGFYTQKKQENQGRVLRMHGVGFSKEDGNAVTKGLGTVLGVRMRSDVQSAVKFVVEARQRQVAGNIKSNKKDLKLTVTLMGWSRGGIGCIYAAHMISKVWNCLEEAEVSGITLDVRVIAFDPVSGLGTNVRALDMGWDELALRVVFTSLADNKVSAIIDNIVDAIGSLTNWWELPEHVTQFHGFYAHDERSIGFATTMPTMLGEAGNRVFKLYEVPGTHSTLVGNLYPNGGDKAAKDEAPDPVGLHIYRSVVRRAVKLLTEWEVQFDDSIYANWLEPLGVGRNFQLANGVQVPTQEQLATYKTVAQETYITTNTNEVVDLSRIGLTDGRGVYVGGNTVDRKWQPESSLTEFLNEQNSKNVLDSAWQYLVGSETKLKKLGGTVSAHDYDRANASWT
jgi:hypothetical protein